MSIHHYWKEIIGKSLNVVLVLLYAKLKSSLFLLINSLLKVKRGVQTNMMPKENKTPYACSNSIHWVQGFIHTSNMLN